MQPGDAGSPLRRTVPARTIYALVSTEPRTSRSTSNCVRSSPCRMLASARIRPPFPHATRIRCLLGLALPMPTLPGAGKGSIELAAEFNWGKTALVQTARDEELIVDAETRELRLQRSVGLTTGSALQWQLPYRYTGAGTLDGFIDDWHDFFGLPKARAPRCRRSVADRLRARQRRAVRHRRVGRGPGRYFRWASVRACGVRASRAPRSGSSLELPLATLTAHRQRRRGYRGRACGRAAPRRSLDGLWAGAAFRGSATAISCRISNVTIVWSAMAGIGFDVASAVRPQRAVRCAHRAYEGSDIDFLGEAVILTVGGAFASSIGSSTSA